MKNAMLNGLQRFSLTLVILATLLCACSAKLHENPNVAQANDTNQAGKKFDSLQELENYVTEDCECELVQLDIPDYICFALYHPDIQAIQFMTVCCDDSQYTIVNLSVKSSFTLDDVEGEVPLVGQYQVGIYNMDFCFSNQSVTNMDMSAYSMEKFSSACLYYRIA